MCHHHNGLHTTHRLVCALGDKGVGALSIDGPGGQEEGRLVADQLTAPLPEVPKALLAVDPPELRESTMELASIVVHEMHKSWAKAEGLGSLQTRSPLPGNAHQALAGLGGSSLSVGMHT
jgi:hypothetical protein